MYDSDTSAVTTALQSSNPTVFSDKTISDILALTTKDNATVNFQTSLPDANGNVTVAAGAEVVFVTSSDTTQTTVHAPVNAPVVIFQGKGGVIATINDGPTTVPGHAAGVVDRVVVGTAGNDSIVVADGKNSEIILGSGNSTVTTGHGVDTVEAGLGNSTIIGGSGDYAVVKLAGNATNYQVTAQNGHAVVTDMTTHNTTDISKIQYVQLDSGNALIFAKDSVEASVANLYQTAFGRTAEAGGLNYWFDLVKAGANLHQVADAFTHSTEFAAQASLSNTDFIQGLYQHTFNRAGEDSGVAYWADQIAHGSTRADLITEFAQIATQNILHTAANQEAQVVGSVMIVTGII
jgi:Ca2+-binding RTX toxin-like protein